MYPWPWPLHNPKKMRIHRRAEIIHEWFACSLDCNPEFKLPVRSLRIHMPHAQW